MLRERFESVPVSEMIESLRRRELSELRVRVI